MLEVSTRTCQPNDANPVDFFLQNVLAVILLRTHDMDLCVRNASTETAIGRCKWPKVLEMGDPSLSISSGTFVNA